MSEPDTLKDIVSGLKKEDGLFSSERTIVMDAGIATEDNIALIKRVVTPMWPSLHARDRMKTLFGQKQMRRRLLYQTEKQR
ncbi:MAG: hypothetical protein HS132_07125 [Planctomycetia bacterium]|nr:hypothetical protein [Planctomycetia bacterium]